MADDDTNSPPARMVWCDNKPKKKDVAYYASQRNKFETSFKDNEFLTIPEALEAVNTRTSDVRSRKLMGARGGNHGRGI